MAKPQSKSNPKPSPRPDKTLISTQWSGPLPPPGALQQFDAIIPDGANRIMKMVEAEQQARLEHERTVLAAMTRDTRRGHYIGAGISLGAIIGCVISVYLRAPAAVSIALVGIPVLGMIKAVIGSKTNSK